MHNSIPSVKPLYLEAFNLTQNTRQNKFFNSDISLYIYTYIHLYIYIHIYTYLLLRLSV